MTQLKTNYKWECFLIRGKMTQDETLEWFQETAIRKITDINTYGNFYYVYQSDSDQYCFTIEYQPWHLENCPSDRCDECYKATEHENCGVYGYVTINEDGSITYGDDWDGETKTYQESEFEDLLNIFT